MVTIALSHLLGRGVVFSTNEAVALARQLLGHPCGIPVPENVQIGSDGSATCISSDGALSVAGAADLLSTLLPPGTPNVPGPLRYAIARALGAVEAPPFASLDEFSGTLHRFEKGDSRDVLRAVMQRAVRPSPPIAPAIVVPPPVPPPVAPPTLRSFGVDEAAGSPVREGTSRRWALAAAAALVASFALGFGVADRIIDSRAATQPPSSPRPPTVSDAAPAANDVRLPKADANLPAGERSDAVAHVPRTDARRPPVDTDDHVTAIEAVRATTGTAFSPAFTSDGTAIFFHTGGERDGRSAIDVANAGDQPGGDLGIMTVVDDGSHNYHAQPSPDGRFVAFDSDREGERGVYLANRDGSHVRRISGAGYAAVPTWSRNGEWLAYVRGEADKPSVWNLWVQPVAGGDARRVTNYRYGQTWAASWFPDDRRIAYSHEDTLIVMDVHSGEATRYPTPLKGQLVRTPAVSPDGTKIIFQVFRDGAWLFDLADGSMQRVLTDPTAEEFAWSPDGRRVAFHSRRDGRWGIYVLTRG